MFETSTQIEQFTQHIDLLRDRLQQGALAGRGPVRFADDMILADAELPHESCWPMPSTSNNGPSLVTPLVHCGGISLPRTSRSS
jgi:hypothetical protein